MEVDKLSQNPKYIGAMKYSVLEKLPRVEEGEIAFCTDTHQIMIYKNNEWNEFVDDSNDGLTLNLYDLNKSIISQMPDLTQEKIQESIELINNFKKSTDNMFYMLYGYEINYFTLFRTNEYAPETIGEAIINCLESVGTIKAIDSNFEANAIEIWINYISEDSEPILTMLYLFPYDMGVVEVQ